MMVSAAAALPSAVCLDWRPVRRANPRSTLRGFADVRIKGLIFRHLSICGSDGRFWVVIPSRLRLDDNNMPFGVGEHARWDPVVEFTTNKVRTAFCLAVLHALQRDFPEALGPVEAARLAATTTPTVSPPQRYPTPPRPGAPRSRLPDDPVPF